MQCNLFHVACRRPGLLSMLLSILLLVGSIVISLPLAAQSATPPAAIAGSLPAGGSPVCRREEPGKPMRGARHRGALHR